MIPTEGDEAPEFSLPDQDGETVSLSDFAGRKVVLYFYPKDDTPGCTTEACQFEDALPRFGQMDAVVLGISPDSPESHRSFQDKYDLSFTLLADEEHAVAEGYGVWKEKSMFGNTFWGVERTTFLIDEKGKIARVWQKVRPDGHADEVAEAFEG